MSKQQRRCFFCLEPLTDEIGPAHDGQHQHGSEQPNAIGLALRNLPEVQRELLEAAGKVDGGLKNGVYAVGACKRCILRSKVSEQWEMMFKEIFQGALQEVLLQNQRGDRSFIRNRREYEKYRKAERWLLRECGFEDRAMRKGLL